MWWVLWIVANALLLMCFVSVQLLLPHVGRMAVTAINLLTLPATAWAILNAVQLPAWRPVALEIAILMALERLSKELVPLLPTADRWGKYAWLRNLLTGNITWALLLMIGFFVWAAAWTHGFKLPAGGYH